MPDAGLVTMRFLRSLNLIHIPTRFPVAERLKCAASRAERWRHLSTQTRHFKTKSLSQNESPQDQETVELSRKERIANCPSRE